MVQGPRYQEGYDRLGGTGMTETDPSELADEHGMTLHYGRNSKRSKLDEIGARINQQQAQAGVEGGVPVVIHDDEVLLLIQGLRELWAVHKEWYSQRPELLERDLSPEVVELFKDHPDAPN